MSAPKPDNVIQLVPPPRLTWAWHVFGRDFPFIVFFNHPVSPWRRWTTRLLLGSRWERG